MGFLDSITASAHNPATETALSLVAGDNNTVREFRAGRALIVGVSCVSLPLTQFKIISPRLHDAINGFSFRSLAESGFSLFSVLPHGFEQRLQSGDLLQLRVNPTAGETDVYLALSIYYEHLQSGGKAFYISPDELERRGVNVKTVQYDTVAPSTLSYGNQKGISDGLFKTDREYALLGANNETLQGTTLRIQAEETGRYKILLPLDNLEGNSINYFSRLSRRYNLPLIPTFKGINISTLVVESISPLAEHIDLFFAELAP